MMQFASDLSSIRTTQAVSKIFSLRMKVATSTFQEEEQVYWDAIKQIGALLEQFGFCFHRQLPSGYWVQELLERTFVVYVWLEEEFLHQTGTRWVIPIQFNSLEEAVQAALEHNGGKHA